MRTAVRVLLIVIFAVHGLIHCMGSAKGFGWANITALKQPISRTMAILWLVTALLVLATAVPHVGELVVVDRCNRGPRLPGGHHDVLE